MGREIKGPDGLTARERAYVKHLGTGMQQIEAYIQAYKPTAGTRRTHTYSAHDIAARPQVAAAIAKFRAIVAQELVVVAKEQGVTRERISAVLAKIAFSNGLMLGGPKGKTRITVSVKEIRNAAMDLARLHGFIIERRDVRVIHSIEDLTDEELAKLAGNEEREHHGTRH